MPQFRGESNAAVAFVADLAADVLRKLEGDASTRCRKLNHRARPRAGFFRLFATI